MAPLPRQSLCLNIPKTGSSFTTWFFDAADWLEPGRNRDRAADQAPRPRLGEPRLRARDHHAGYAHVGDREIEAAAERVGQAIDAIMRRECRISPIQPAILDQRSCPFRGGRPPRDPPQVLDPRDRRLQRQAHAELRHDPVAGREHAPHGTRTCRTALPGSALRTNHPFMSLSPSIRALAPAAPGAAPGVRVGFPDRHAHTGPEGGTPAPVLRILPGQQRPIRRRPDRGRIAQSLRLLEAGETHEFGHIAPVAPAVPHAPDAGEPFRLARRGNPLRGRRRDGVPALRTCLEGRDALCETGRRKSPILGKRGFPPPACPPVSIQRRRNGARKAETARRMAEWEDRCTGHMFGTFGYGAT